MNKVFAVSDIHGHAHEFDALLTNHWNADNEQLVVMGDLVDRGPDSLRVVQKCMELKEKYGAVILMGNHEELFLDWLEDPATESNFYFDVGGAATVDSFLQERVSHKYDSVFLANRVKQDFQKEISFLKTLPSYFEWNNYVFVHAGVNLYTYDWRYSSDKDFKWSRNEFIYAKNLHPDTLFVFGHTQTKLLHLDKSNDIWFSKCKTKIGIDGGICSGGQLNGLKLHNQNIDFIFEK